MRKEVGTAVSTRSDRQVKVTGGHISWFGFGESVLWLGWEGGVELQW